MRSREDIERAIGRFGDTVWRVCALRLRETADAQDAFQETFLRYATSDTAFSDDEHRKAWLIRVATNVGKDMLKAAARRTVPLDGAQEAPPSRDPLDVPDSRLREALDAIASLPDPPKTPVYLALYEGYTAPEIAKMLDAPVNTVYSWISRGKQRLKEALA